MLTNIVFSIAANTGALYADWENMLSGQQNIIMNMAMSLGLTPPWMFLMGGIERLIAVPAQLAFSVIMFYAVFGKRKIWLYPVAIVAHMITDIPAMLYQTGFITNIAIVESLTAFVAAAVIVFTVWIHDKFKDGVLETQSAKSSASSETEISVGEEPEITVNEESDITVTSESEPEKE
jgi:uncharacterized membrane protein YhfC